MGKEIVTYHEQMTYVGNMLTSVRDDASHSAYAGATDFNGVSGQEYPLTYNASGSLTSDAGRGIAWIDYDLNNHPVRIQFTNGNVTKYVYSATGEKLHVTHQTAVPNISVPIGSTRELSPYEIQYTDYTNYLLGGCLTLRNGRIDKYQFEEGYCQAERYVYDASQDEFTFCYYDRDHLGNIRQVTEADGTSTGNVIQTMNYYPFGAEFCDGTANSSVQSHKYNGKELDLMHGLNTYDYGARQYNPVTAHWDRVDPLAEKYYSISAYNYCGNNPIRFIDPDGRDGMLTGTGTKEDPYIITAIYFYQNGSLGNEQIEGLNSAIDSYNSLGGKYGIKIKNEDGTTSYIKYNLSAVGVDDIERSRSETGFETASGEYRYYGNKVGTNPDGGDEFGSGNNNRIDFNIENIKNGICDYGMSPQELNKGIAIHEIGHNLGGEHADGTSVMRTVQTFISTNYTYTCYPSVSKDFTRIIFRRHDTHKRDGSDGRIWSKK